VSKPGSTRAHHRRRRGEGDALELAADDLDDAAQKIVAAVKEAE